MKAAGTVFGFSVFGAQLLVIACGGGPRAGRGHPLRPGETPSVATGVRQAKVLARGTLAYDVAIDARGQRVVSIELGTEFELVSRDLPGGRERWRARLGPADWDVLDVAIAPDGAVATASLDGTVRVHDADGRPRAAWRLDAGATSVAWSPDGAWLVTGADSGVLCLRRVTDGALLQCVAAHDGRIATLAPAPGRVASGGWDGRIVTWELPSLRVLGDTRWSLVNALAWSGDLLVVGAGRVGAWRPARDDTASVLLFDPFAPETEFEQPPGWGTGPGPVSAVASAGGVMVSAWYGGELRVGDARLRLGQLLRGVAVSPDGRWAVVAAWTDRKLSRPSVILMELLYR